MSRYQVLPGAVLFGWTAGHAFAQADAVRHYPERPVRLVVPFGASGDTTTLARVVAAKMSESLGHRLQEEVARAVAPPDVRERFDGLGTDPSGMPGEAFGKVVAAEIARWTAVARRANIKAN